MILPTHPHMSMIKPPSVAFNNVNSLGLTAPGGFSGRKAKIVNLLAAMVSTHDITCLQDIRVPSKNMITELHPFFPRHKFFVSSSDDTNSGGTVIIVTPDIIGNYNIKHNEIYKGNTHYISLTHKTNNTKYNIVNCYLHASDEEAWKEQVEGLENIDYSLNTLVGGDFNHVYNPLDRSGYHSDKSNGAAALYQNWLTDSKLQQIEQNFHTWYGKRGANHISSSKVDRVYHNFDYVTLTQHTPRAQVCTYAPHTVAQYGFKCKYKNDNNHTTLIDNYITRKEGGTHVTDHVPLSIRYDNPHNLNYTKFKSAAIDHEEFITEFDKRWSQDMHSSIIFDTLQEYKKVLTDTSIAVNKKIKKPILKDAQLWDAVRLINAIDQNDEDILTKFEHIPEYLILKDKPAELLAKVNHSFAAKSLDDNGHKTISRIETISRSLPKKKEKISHFYDEEEECITSDKKKMDSIISKFWGNKWKAKQIQDPTQLFEAYGKKIGIPPSEITLDSVKNAIINSNDSAVGPDGIPFAAYRKTLEFIAPILFECIQQLMKGATPPDDFNGGTLLLLPKKNTSKIEDTRPLVINNTDNRLIATIIRDSIVPALDTVLSDDQNGFRKLRSTSDNINFFNEKFYGNFENRKFYDILFVDFCKAFDSISHEAIFKLLTSLGFDSNYLNIIKSLFHKAYCNTSKSTDNTISFDSGVKQGCPLSPTLFIAVADVLIDMLSRVAEVDVKFYADDAAIGAEDITPKLSLIKDCFDIFALHTGLCLNPNKSAAIATGGRTTLRNALDSIGWSEIIIAPNIKYLGIYMGHDTTLDDIFKGPYEKMVERLNTYSKIKNSFSIPKRVTIWNTWILPIFSYIFNFYTIPADYCLWIDQQCQKWLSQGNTFSSLHYTRPTSLLGLASPLKDISIYNYSRLAALSTEAVENNSPSWSIRCSTHRAMARSHVQKAYGVQVNKGVESSTIYTQIIHSQDQTEEFLPYIKDKLNKINLSKTQQKNYINNYKKIPSWIPCYARYNNLSISHNMLPTYRRFSELTPCFLCRKEMDCIHHIYGECTINQQANAQLRNQLKLPICNASFALSMGADKERKAEDLCVQIMLAHSTWRARCNAKNGDRKDTKAWAEWIVADCIQRICKISPSFFSIYFPNNSIPHRYKITYRPDLGSSKRIPAIKNIASQAVTEHINSLAPGSLIAFTDGSAKPNPGPAGAGAILLKKSKENLSLKHCASYTAAIGSASNNTGELYAVGIVLEHCKLTNYTGNLHIYTDSKITYGALRNGWRAGKANSSILYSVREMSHKIRHTCNIHYHWIPGHSNVNYNDTADALANAGADYSDSHRNFAVNFRDSIDTKGFMALVTETNTNLF
jgi:ribonuclease HI/exonuclease III